jgi:hypothetical protein
VRRSIEDLAAGTPNYDRMSSGLADATRAQLPMLQPQLHSLGAIKTVDFKEVAPTGYDVFRVSFENGTALEVIIALSPDGKIETEGLRPASP